MRVLWSSLVVVLAVLAVTLSACEFNGLSSRDMSRDIIDNAERLCGESRDSASGGVDNIMLMESREDDGIVTCHDGTNHYFDG